MNPHKSVMFNYLSSHKSTPPRSGDQKTRKTPIGTSSNTKRSANLPRHGFHTSSKHSTRTSQRKATIHEIPDEVLLKIFSFFGAQDLILVSQVCQRWRNLANDNSLWKPIFLKYAPKSEAEASGAGNVTSVSQLKTTCIRRCVEQRNKRVFRYLRKKSPYTGITQQRDVEKALIDSCVFWQLAFVDASDNEVCVQSRDLSVHTMAASVRWYDFSAQSLQNTKAIRIYSCNPIFFDTKKGCAVKDSPYQRSLLKTFPLKWSSWVSTNKPVGENDTINIYSLQRGLAIAVWKDGGEVAFICVGFNLHHLVDRCLRGNSVAPFSPPLPPVVTDDIDSAFGLHGYNCTVQLRTMKQQIWDQQFRGLNCHSNKGGGYAQFVLIEPHERQIINKEIVFPWKTEAFKGKVQNACWLDITVIDETGDVFWTVSSLVSSKAARQAGVNTLDFEYCDDESRSINFVDEVGKFHMEFSKTDDQDIYITQALLGLTLKAINTRFRSSYR
ncbi:F-box only protein 15-like [Mizuhopecten yessoensis]|uniref:F-box only protein 15 n=1 Tax=Mizuhopecten yessoensis TaxID=6573 RepID=A0A210PRS0_MIZYE|nr:F-box only protein 15-like [Mizuhopecten yessoensis]OWF39190.1 F-box only protein 15 [Mizuhopecten yessoensis]